MIIRREQAARAPQRGNSKAQRVGLNTGAMTPTPTTNTQDVVSAGARASTHRAEAHRAHAQVRVEGFRQTIGHGKKGVSQSNPSTGRTKTHRIKYSSEFYQINVVRGD